jgi:hypothetical protein
MTRRIVNRLTALALLLGLLAGANARAQAPEPQKTWVTMAKPGSREAFQLSHRDRATGMAVTKNAAGLWVPDRRIVVATPEDLRDQARWRGVRRAVFHHLKANGARLAPEPYQHLLAKIRKRASIVMSRSGQGLPDWKMMVLEGGMADQVNAAAWTGGVITIYRPLVDLCFQIASVVVNSPTPRAIDSELWRLSRWRDNKRDNPVPESLTVRPEDRAKRDVVAESILSRVVLHEMGHAASGHVALGERKLIIPGQEKPRDVARQRDKEREADRFATQLGAAGAVRLPGAMPLFSYYHFLERPTFSERGRYGILDWRTHPIDAERYNNQLAELKALKRTIKGLPEPLAPRIVLPGGGYATPDPLPIPTPKPVAPTAEPLRKAALR